MSMNFMERISDTQKQLTRCKDILTLIWHQEIEGESQGKIKLKIAMAKRLLEDSEDILDDGVILDK